MKQTRFKKVPFNLELAKKITNKDVKGRIVTQDGRKVRIICFDRMGRYPIVCLAMRTDGTDILYSCSENGRENNTCESSLDLHIEVPTYYKDYSNFKPCKWQPCMVRDNDKDLWEISICAGRNSVGKATFYHRGCTYSHQHCLPLSKVTERLVDTRKSYEELIQELDAELTATTKNNDNGSK